MSSVPAVLTRSRPTLLGRLLDFAELAKLRIVVLEAIVVIVSMAMASSGAWEFSVLVATLLGTVCVAASASAGNQWLERERDLQMVRTCNRPLPSGRMQSPEAIAFSAITLLLGAILLGVFTGVLPLMAALLTWIAYVVLYTPLKSRSIYNTHVGAIAGALPVAIGWLAAGGEWNRAFAGLFAVLVLWQFPHFMAIAWLYRHEYAAAGFRMLPAVDVTGNKAGQLAVGTAAALLPCSLLPIGLDGSMLGVALSTAVIICGLLQLRIAWCFHRQPAELSARKLLHASLLYLPAVLGCYLLAALT